MSLMKVIARIECDKCGQQFEADIANDAVPISDKGDTMFEIVIENLDCTYVPGRDKLMEEAGYYDGEFYCAKCWEPKSEELFIADIKAGKITAAQLRDWGEEYLKYVPKEEA